MSDTKRNTNMIIWIGVAIAIIVGVATPLITKKNDTMPEEMAEAYIYRQTGKQIDFSPSEELAKPDIVEPEVIK